jgi:hydrogenase-4 component H
MFGAKLRQITFGLRNPRATVGYPLAPKSPEPGYRGRVAVDTDKCIGCGGCADVCPARCILITDLGPATRIIRRHLDRCIQCGRCEDACGYDAVHMVADWETGTPDRRDLLIEQRLHMGVCDRCGRCYVPAHPLDQLVSVEMRVDEPELLAQAKGGDVATSGAVLVGPLPGNGRGSHR